MDYKGFIFDMDGVVVDNHRFHFDAWMAFAKAHNFELNDQIYRESFNGKTNQDLFRMIFKDPSEAQMRAYAEEKEGLYQDLYRDHIQSLKGIVDFLDHLKARKKRVALGTSAPPMNVDFTLDRLSLRKYFDAIVDGTMVSRGKPHPEVYLQASHRLGLNPKDCVVFEDSLAGLEAGSRAGCGIIAVATSHRPSELSVVTEKIIVDFTEVRRFVEF